jgi:hypothetical protein
MRSFVMCNVYCALNVVTVIRGRRRRWAGNVARTAQKMHSGFGVEISGIRKIIIVIIIFIIINCSWVDTRWQWLFYMYTKYDTGYYNI